MKKNQNKIKALFVGLALFATSLVPYAVSATEPVEVEPGDGAEITVCHCTFWGNCKASGSGNICASGTETDPNIKCSDYKDKC